MFPDWHPTRSHRTRSHRTPRAALAALSFAALLAGCAAVQFGRDFDPRQFEAKVQRSVSTRDDVRSWLGEPNSMGAGMNDRGDRFEEWTYYQGSGTLPNLADANLKVLQIRFDAQGHVLSWSWTGERKKPAEK